MPSPPAKAHLRALALARRSAVSPKEAETFAHHIAKRGSELGARLAARSAAAYASIRDEASTLPLLVQLAQSGIETALPVMGPRDESLSFRLWRPGDPTLPGRMGIAEPLASAREILPDLLFVPLAACDRAGHRIGYGAGYYDRTLAMLRAQKPIIAVGIAYACQLVDEIPYEAHDQRLDYVLTEGELIDCQSG
ncbi:MAG TPA: 5-formyltetrahydrofolate cyclo-ligase [Beijerinckia sp.]|jgi:5-formyltetrahydrofolate cyclo-ligase|nr:5-formyltetrahydrofolate cyclo-ligase [Beijerinckia sp.]